MAHVPRMFALTALLALPTVQASDIAPTLHYTVTPVLEHGSLKAVNVELKADAGPDGTLGVVLPGTQLDVSSDGSLSAGEHDHLVLTGKPHATLTLRYQRRGNTALDGEWDTDPYMADGWLLARCPLLLAMPDDDIARRVEVTWKLPARWRGLSDVPASAPATRAERSNSTCFIGRDISEVTYPLGHGGHLRVYTTDPHTSAPLVDLARKALTIAGTDVDGRPVDYPLYIGMANRDGDGFAGWSKGTGMALVAERDVDLNQVIGPAISDYIHLREPAPVDPATAWYTQGLRSYLVASDLLAAHRLGRRYVAGWLDQIAGQYGSSAFRRAPNTQVVSGWASSPDLQALPGQRGVLFGALLDSQLREATAGKAALADVLRGMDAHPADPAIALADAIKAAGGGDITPLYEKYIVRGELLLLPGDALGACMTVSTDQDGYGWQVQHIAATCNP